MKPMILKVGKVYEDAEGKTHLEDWHFDASNLPPARVFTDPQDVACAFLGLMKDDPLPDGYERWTIEELREIAEQEAVLTLLPTTEDSL